MLNKVKNLVGTIVAMIVIPIVYVGYRSDRIMEEIKIEDEGMYYGILELAEQFHWNKIR